MLESNIPLMRNLQLPMVLSDSQSWQFDCGLLDYNAKPYTQISTIFAKFLVQTDENRFFYPRVLQSSLFNRYGFISALRLLDLASQPGRALA